MRWLPFVSLVGVLAACGGKEHPPTIPSTGEGGYMGTPFSGGNAGTTSTQGGGGGKASTGGGAGKGGNGGKGGLGQAGDMAGGEGGASNLNDLAPVVTITSPVEVTDPNAGGVLVGDDADTVTVVCEVAPSTEPGAALVDTSSVQIAVYTLPDRKVIDHKPGKPTGNPNEYSADLVVRTIQNGAIGIQCAAADKAAPPRTGLAELQSYIDHGPTITPTSPSNGAPYGLLGPVHFEFEVEAAPVGPRDAGASIGDVTLAVGGVAITSLAPVATRPGVYTADVNFSDKKLFPVTPSGTTQVTITAGDTRTPVAAVRTLTYAFLLDGEAPTTKITAPVGGRVIGAATVLAFTVADTGAGVDLRTVTVHLNGVDYPFEESSPLWTHAMDGSFTFLVDTSKFPSSKSQVTISVSAADLAGNKDPQRYDSILAYLDTQRPFVSLDPPLMRVVNVDTTNGVHCSAPFDPVGDGAANDLSTVPDFARFRVFAWDRTNEGPGQTDFYFAGVDPATVHLYIQQEAAGPLLVDADGDGACDTIAPGAKTLPSNIGLDPVPNMGAMDTRSPDFTSLPDVSGEGCTVQDAQVKHQCSAQASDMTFVPRQTKPGQNGNYLAVYAPQVFAETTVCTGSKWELPSVQLTDGWLCIAAEAADSVGNVGVSAPIRVCFDRSDTKEIPACASMSSSTPPPTCTQSCTPPSQSLWGDDSQGTPKPFFAYLYTGG